MLDLRLVDGYHDGRGPAIGIFAPVVLPENPECLSYRLVETLRGDLDRMLDALRVPRGNLACSDHHPPEDSSFALCSPIRDRYQASRCARICSMSRRAQVTWAVVRNASHDDDGI